MKVLFRQFLGKSHSWSVTGWGLAQAFKKLGHTVDLFSTNGIQNFPSSLKENLIGYTEENSQAVFGKMPSEKYDCQISYTSMKNFPYYLSNGSKNRFGIWCYEWAGNNCLPTGFAKHYKSCDFLCAPSNFAKRVFMESKIPESSIKVIPHGINIDEYNKTSTIDLKTKKKFKILSNIAQNHIRKNIPGLLDAYGKAFSDKDDVCLILKAKNKPVNYPFDISLSDCINDFRNKYSNHAELKVFSEFVNDISSLYRSVDCAFTMSNSEGYYMPGLEIIASGKMAIAPNWGGQLDFLNDTNSLLIDGKETRANPKSMYWESKNDAIWFEPSIDDAVEKLRYAYQNFESFNQKVNEQKSNVHQKYSWEAISKEFINLCQ